MSLRGSICLTNHRGNLLLNHIYTSFALIYLSSCLYNMSFVPLHSLILWTRQRPIKIHHKEQRTVKTTCQIILKATFHVALYFPHFIFGPIWVTLIFPYGNTDLTLYSQHMETPKMYQKGEEQVERDNRENIDWRLKQYFSITTLKKYQFLFALFHRNSMAWIHSFLSVRDPNKMKDCKPLPETIWKHRYCCRNTYTLVRVLHLSPRKWFTLFINIGFGEGQGEQEREGARV